MSTKQRIINEDGNLIEIEPKEEPKEEPVESFDCTSNDIEFEEVTIDGSSNSLPSLVNSKDNPKVSNTHNKKSVSSKKPAVYVCKPCDVSYSDHHSLTRHFNLVHQNKAKEPEVKQKLTKSIIEKLQERAKGYSQTKDGKFACNYCDYKSVLSVCVSGHVARLHKNHEQSIAVRTSSITLAIEPIVKNELDVKPDEEIIITDDKEQVVVEEEVPTDSAIDGITEDLVEGDAEMVQEANELLAHDDDYVVEEDNEAVGYGVHPYDAEDYGDHDEMEGYGDQVDYEEEVEEVEETGDYTDHIEDSADYEDEVEYVEDCDTQYVKTGDLDAQVETESVEGAEEHQLNQEFNNAQLVTYTCPYCDYTTTDKVAIHQHITTTHTDVLAKKIRGTIESIEKNKEKRNQKRKRPGFKCMYCDFVGRTRTIVYEHSRVEHPGTVQPAKWRKEPPYDLKCDRCDFMTTERRKMMMHIERKHTTEYKFTCEYCGKKFKVKCDLSSHIRFQHFKKPLVCDVCGKVCSNSNSLHVHQKREHYQPQFECHICHRRMVTQENLDEHILRQHEQRTTFMCDQCGKVFDQASKLKQHTMTHTGERPHTCHLCGKAFARRAVFRQHLLIHTGEKPYKCDICGKSFTQKPGLICHRKVHPGEKPPLPVVYIDHILKKIEQKIGE